MVVAVPAPIVIIRCARPGLARAQGRWASLASAPGDGRGRDLPAPVVAGSGRTGHSADEAFVDGRPRQHQSPSPSWPSLTNHQHPRRLGNGRVHGLLRIISDFFAMPTLLMPAPPFYSALRHGLPRDGMFLMIDFLTTTAVSPLLTDSSSRRPSPTAFVPVAVRGRAAPAPPLRPADLPARWVIVSSLTPRRPFPRGGLVVQVAAGDVVPVLRLVVL